MSEYAKRKCYIQSHNWEKYDIFLYARKANPSASAVALTSSFPIDRSFDRSLPSIWLPPLLRRSTPISPPHLPTSICTRIVYCPCQETARLYLYLIFEDSGK